MRETPDCPAGTGQCCPGCGRAPLPETLTQLVEDSRAVPLDLDLPGLALLGTALDDAQIITHNHGALVQARGGYGRFQSCGEPFRPSERRIPIRVAEGRNHAIMRSDSDADKRHPAAISVVGRDGRVGHRIQFFSEADWLAACCIDVAADQVGAPCDGDMSAEPDCAANIVRLDTVRYVRDRWSVAGFSDHLDDLLLDRRADRMTNLCYVGTARARRVSPAHLASFLSFLCDRQLPFSATVPAAGLIQTLSGRGEALHSAGSVVLCETSRGMFSLDLARVAYAWVTRVGGTGQNPSAMLELYDDTGRCLVLLHADPWSEAANWAAWLEALPTQKS